VKKIQLIIIAFIACGFISVQAQKVKMLDNFAVGERIEFMAFYNLGFIWVEAGEMSLSVSNVDHEGQKSIKIEAIGRSLPKYDWMYRIRDTFVSIAEPRSLNPYTFKRRTNEGTYSVKNDYVFNWGDRKIYSEIENSDDPFKKDTLELKSSVFDLMTAMYHARKIDFKSMSIGDEVPVRTVVDNEVVDIYIKYLGLESIENKITEKEVSCIKLSATMVGGTIFEEGEELYAWVSNDLDQLPIQVEAQILVGSVKAFLKSANNTKTQQLRLVRDTGE